MSVIVPAVLGGLALVVMALVSASASKRKREAGQSTEFQAAILVHDINDDRCTGCDACVAVCPTNVLDLVDNKSRVLRFQDCIQCEACMWACPTEALVMFKEGSTPPPLVTPELDDFYQTAVPGQYLIGEVAGKPLVKNAANLGRAVVEHILTTGLAPNTAAQLGPGSVDVCIVGSGPGGISAALTCVQRGLSYVLLEKEQIIASTVARYPKGKLIMAEPYDTRNVSLLPVYDSSKEELIPIWRQLIEDTGLKINMGEAVEEIQPQPNGVFQVRTTVGGYQALRVILATGTRGKPRTLQVTGENLPKVHSLLEDPDQHRGQSVLVVGGGDSALEAVTALADAGAKVILSYRGRSFSRAQPKLRQTVENYEKQRRIKIKYQSTVLEFDEHTVTLQMVDGSLKKYPNEASFVLIGSEPPVKWLKKMGVEFVERPHQYALPQSDRLVEQLLGPQADCPDTAHEAAGVVLGREVQSKVEARSKGRKWLRSATSLFGKGRKLDRPMSLGEFAKQNRRHSGNGRRDALDAGERTRVLRMLRDEGGRLADEESAVYVFNKPTQQPQWADDASEFITQQTPAPIRNMAPPSAQHRHGDGPEPKQAVIVGLAQATARGPRAGRSKRSSAPPPQERASASQRGGTAEFLNSIIADNKGEESGNVFGDDPTAVVPPGRLQAALQAGLAAAPNEATQQVDVNSFASPRVVADSVSLDSGNDGVYSSGSPRPFEDPTKAVDVRAFAVNEQFATADEDPTRQIDLNKHEQREPSLSDVDWDLD